MNVCVDLYSYSYFIIYLTSLLFGIL